MIRPTRDEVLGVVIFVVATLLAYVAARFWPPPHWTLWAAP